MDCIWLIAKHINLFVHEAIEIKNNQLAKLSYFKITFNGEFHSITLKKWFILHSYL